MSLRYLKKRKYGKGYRWDLKPPQEAVDAGVVKCKVFDDGRKARAAAMKAAKAVDDWRRGEISADFLSPNCTFAQAAIDYEQTGHFKSLSHGTIRKYSSGFKAISEVRLSSKRFGDTKVKNIDAKTCQKLYEHWLKKSANNAIEYSRIFSIIMSHCMSLDLITHNPMSKIKKVPVKPKSIIWTQDQVKTFLQYCFENFEYRNTGLIVYMAYEWCQRPRDIRNLTWDALDLEAGVVTITQSKRGATVQMSILGNLLDLLKKQKEDYDYQPFVVPYFRKTDKAWRPLTASYLHQSTKKVLDATGLPNELSSGYLRKSGIVEMVEAGVDASAMMSVTGHQNISSLNPYIKHTKSAADNAQRMRGLNK